MLRIIAGIARGRRIDAPEGKDTRPTLDRVRENLFNMIQTRIRDARTLDLFAGSGALSLEALSRGAAFAVMADHDRNAYNVVQKNIAALRFEKQTRMMLCDWRKAAETLKAEGSRFDLVFLDPPYAMTDLTDVLNSIADLLDEDALVIVEHEARAELTVPESFRKVNSRNWGYCGVSFFMMTETEEETV